MFYRVVYRVSRRLVPSQIQELIKSRALTKFKLLTEKKKRYRREQHCTFGNKNPDTIFYIIRKDYREDSAWGLFAVWKYVLQHLVHAEAKGYIPIVDLKNYYMPMLQDDGKMGKENAWEYYFTQPCPKWSLSDVYESKNVILADMDYIPNQKRLYYLKLPLPNKAFKYWTNISNMHHKYLNLNSDIMACAINAEMTLFPKNVRIMGVSLRRSFNRLRLTGHINAEMHPKQPELDEYMADIESYLDEWKCDYFLLSTDDREACDTISERFKSRCLLMERPRRRFFYKGSMITDMGEIHEEFQREDNVYLTAKEYMTEVILLSRCTCLLAGGAGGVQAAYIMNNGAYEHVKLYEVK